MFAYSVEVTRNLNTGSNFPFILPVAFLCLEIFFCINTIRSICANIHTCNAVLTSSFEDSLYFTFRFTLL